MKRQAVLALSLAIVFFMSSLINCACASAEPIHPANQSISDASDCHHSESSKSAQKASQDTCCGKCQSDKAFTPSASELLKSSQKNKLSSNILTQMGVSGVIAISNVANLKHMVLLDSGDALRVSTFNSSLYILIRSLRI